MRLGGRGLTLRCTRLATAGFARFRERVNSNVRPAVAEERDAKQELERLLAEAEGVRAKTAAEMERLRSGRVSPEQARRFIKGRRARLWRMPIWLWVPVVMGLIALFLLALYAASR